LIFRKAQNKIQDPEKLERLISMINKESWSSLSIDVKGEIYEGLLQKGLKVRRRVRASTLRQDQSLRLL
jgi:type I restriction enzyme M protein